MSKKKPRKRVSKRKSKRNYRKKTSKKKTRKKNKTMKGGKNPCDKDGTSTECQVYAATQRALAETAKAKSDKSVKFLQSLHTEESAGDIDNEGTGMNVRRLPKKQN